MAEEPERDAAIDTCLEAWSDLSTCRGSLGLGVGAIPWTAIVMWCEWNSDILDRDAARVVIAIVRQLDNDTLERIAAKQRLENALGANR